MTRRDHAHLVNSDYAFGNTNVIVNTYLRVDLFEMNACQLK